MPAHRRDSALLWPTLCDEARTNTQKAEDVKLSLVTESLTIYLDNSKESTKKLLDLGNLGRSEDRYKINIEKKIVYI